MTAGDITHQVPTVLAIRRDLFFVIDNVSQTNCNSSVNYP